MADDRLPDEIIIDQTDVPGDSAQPENAAAVSSPPPIDPFGALELERAGKQRAQDEAAAEAFGMVATASGEMVPWYAQYAAPSDARLLAKLERLSEGLERDVALREAEGAITLDPRREAESGLVFSSLSDRLQRNGVAERMLEIAVRLAQDPTVPPKVRLDAAKAVLDRAYGPSMKIDSDNKNIVLVKIDV